MLWSLLALLSLGLGTLATVHELGKRGLYLGEHRALARGKQPTERFEVSLRDDGRVAAFSGGINDGAAAAIDKAIGDGSKVGTLLLDSPGGWLRESTAWPMSCAATRSTRGSKAIAFPPAPWCCSPAPIVRRETRLRSGFHRGRSVGESTEDRALPASREESELYRRARPKPDVVRRIGTPNDSIWIPSRYELLHKDGPTR